VTFTLLKNSFHNLTKELKPNDGTIFQAQSGTANIIVKLTNLLKGGSQISITNNLVQFKGKKHCCAATNLIAVLC